MIIVLQRKAAGLLAANNETAATAPPTKKSSVFCSARICEGEFYAADQFEVLQASDAQVFTSVMLISSSTTSLCRLGSKLMRRTWSSTRSTDEIEKQERRTN